MDNSTLDSRSNSIDKSFTFKTHINYPKQGGENSTPAEDEGISSSDHDDSEENIHQIQNNFNLYNVYGVQNNKSTKNKYNYDYDKNSIDPAINEVMEDFQNVINDVKNLNCRNKPQRPKNEKISHFGNSDFQPVSRAIILQEENDIIPSKILPEPPKKSRSLHFLNENVERNPFFEDESVENSNCSCSSRDCSLSAESDHEYSKVEYLYCKNEAYSNKSTQVNERKNLKPNGLKRSETFHHLQNKKDTPVQSYRKNGLSDCSSDKFYEHKTKLTNSKNKNYIIQNSNNFEKEMKNRNSNLKSNTKVLRSISTKPVINNLKSTNFTSFPSNVKMNPISYFINKPTNVFPANAPHFSLKRHNNAGLYSGKNHMQNINHIYNHQVTTVTSNFPKRCASSSREINYGGYDGKIMDLPSGLY